MIWENVSGKILFRDEGEACTRKLMIGGADGIVNRLSKKPEEKPLNLGLHCHLRVLAVSLRNPYVASGHPQNTTIWQQLVTVEFYE